MRLKGSCDDNTVPNANYKEHTSTAWEKMSERSKEAVRKWRKGAK